jgi:hypothetical protein
MRDDGENLGNRDVIPPYPGPVSFACLGKMQVLSCLSLSSGEHFREYAYTWH